MGPENVPARRPASRRVQHDLDAWERIGRRREWFVFAARIVILLAVIVAIALAEGLTGGPTP